MMELWSVKRWRKVTYFGDFNLHYIQRSLEDQLIFDHIYSGFDQFLEELSSVRLFSWWKLFFLLNGFLGISFLW